MTLSETPDEIVIRYAPFWKWIAGAVSTLVFGIFCCWLLYQFLINPAPSESSAKDQFGMLLLIAFSTTIVLMAVFEITFASLVFAPLVTVCINQKTMSIDIIRRRFYGSRTERFYFNQIQKFKSYKGNLNFSPRYFLALVLANQKTIKLKIPIRGDKQETIRFVKKLNKFIRAGVSPARSSR